MTYPGSKELSYLVGVYLGDGYVAVTNPDDREGKRYKFVVKVSDEQFLEIINEFIEKITGNSYSISKTDNGNYFRLNCTDIDLSKQLLDCTDKKSEIPEWIKNGSDEIKRYFIAGFLDSDGWVHISKPQYRWENSEKGRRQLTMGFVTTFDWVDDIIEILNSLGVKTGKRQYPKKQDEAHKQIYKHTINRRTFVENNCFFLLERKQEKIRHYNENILQQ